MVYERMYKKLKKELFKVFQRENNGSWNKEEQIDFMKGSFEQSLLKDKPDRKRRKQLHELSKEQFMYQMDDYEKQVNKYLLEPSFIREMYQFELAITIALIN